MSAQPQSFLTPEEYLAFERQADFKSEYFQGETFALAGTSRRHNRLVVNLTISLGGKLLPKGCEVFANDMRVKVEANGPYTYPDLAVVCSEPRFEDTELDTLLNPELLIEVLSPSTEAYDRGRKFDLYRQLDSLTDYLLVAQEQAQVLHYRSKPAGIGCCTSPRPSPTACGWRNGDWNCRCPNSTRASSGRFPLKVLLTFPHPDSKTRQMGGNQNHPEPKSSPNHSLCVLSASVVNHEWEQGGNVGELPVRTPTLGDH